MEWFGQQLTELPAEYERIIPPPGKTLRAAVSGWRLGYKVVHIKPGYQPREKIAVGLDIERLDEPDHIHHWCIIGPEPVAQLEPELARGAGVRAVVSIALRGRAPTQHWMIGVEPATGG